MEWTYTVGTLTGMVVGLCTIWWRLDTKIERKFDTLDTKIERKLVLVQFAAEWYRFCWGFLFLCSVKKGKSTRRCCPTNSDTLPVKVGHVVS